MNLVKSFSRTKSEPIKTYKDYWNWFITQEGKYHKVVKSRGDIEQNFFDKVSPVLKELNDGIYLLTGMCDTNTVELVYSAEGTVKNMHIIEDLVKSAPSINGWKFTALKPSLDIKDVSISMSGFEFNKDNLHFYANESSAYPDEIDITIAHPEYSEENYGVVTSGVYIFLDNLLGELNFASVIDNLSIVNTKEAKKELVPVEKIKSYLTWREKEFVEKYEGTRRNTDNDTYSMLQAELENGNALFAVINAELLNWDKKASHPWILTVQIKYDGNDNNGMPDGETYSMLGEIEDEILVELKDFEGYINIGRQTAENVREVYFACKEFRKPSRVMFDIQKKYSNKPEISFDIYKDKYWKSFERFVKND